MLKLACAFTLFLICCAPAFGQGASVARLRDVKSIYVAELGESEWAKVIREKLVRELAKRFKVVDTPAEADAVLGAAERAGTRNVDRQYANFKLEIATGSQVVISHSLAFSLRSKQRRALWSLKLDTANYHGQDEYHKALALAARVSGEVLKAFDQDGKRRANGARASPAVLK